MKLVKFEIEKAKSGDYHIVTREGLPVRIICWDALCTNHSCNTPIIGLVKTTTKNIGLGNAYKYEICIEYSVRGKVNDYQREDDGIGEYNEDDYDLFLTKDEYDDNIVIISEWDEPNQYEDYLWEKHYESDDTDKRVESEMEILRKHVKKNKISKILERVLRENDLRVYDAQNHSKQVKNIIDQLVDLDSLCAKEFL